MGLDASQAEFLVARALLAQNWAILSRNFRAHGTELDLVAQKGKTIAVVEVKYRKVRPATMEDWLSLLSRRKQQSLRRGALTFLTRHQLNPESLRFDLAVVWGSSPPYGLDYKYQAFD